MNPGGIEYRRYDDLRQNGQFASAAGQPPPTMQAQTKQTTFASVIDRLGELSVACKANLDRLDGLLERAYGPMSPGKPAEPANSMGPGHIGALAERLQSVRALVDAQTLTIARLEEII